MLTIRYNSLMCALAMLWGVVAVTAPWLIGLALVMVSRESGRLPSALQLSIPCVGMILMAVFIIREARSAYAVLSENGIEHYSPWFGWTKILWSEVERVDTYPNGYVVIRGDKRKSIRFGWWYWQNYKAMRDILERQVGPKIKLRSL